MEKNKRNLLLTQAFAFLGQGVVGIFFPFYVAEAFDWEVWQIVVWFGVVMIGMGSLMYPANYWGIRFGSVRRMIQIGIGCQALFYAGLSLQVQDWVTLSILSVLFVLALCFFWPSFHLVALRSTMDGNRGDFSGHLQMVLIGVNIVAPIITGFLWEMGQQDWILLVAVLFFVSGMLCAQQLKIEHTSFVKFRAFSAFVRKDFLGSRYSLGFVMDSIPSVTLWMLWPVYFKFVLSSFSLMGIIVTIAAGVEVIVSKVFGRLTDKLSAQRMLKLGIWARAVDFWIRTLYLVFPTVYVVGGGQILAGILGPIFQIPLLTRMYDIIENYRDHLLEFFVAREVFLGFGRGVFMFLAGGLIYVYGVGAIGFLMLVAGLSLFAFWSWTRE